MEEKIGLAKIEEMLDRIEVVEWDDLPDLDLYMDQVTGYLNRLLAPFSLGREEAPLTPSMINNYVKNGHIARPVQKKYSREQLAALYMLCSMKKNLSIPDAAALIAFLSAQEGAGEAYDRFAARQRETVVAVGEQILSLGKEPSDESLIALAREFAQRACAERLAAEALIATLVGRHQKTAEEMKPEEKKPEKKAAKKPEKKAANKPEKKPSKDPAKKPDKKVAKK